MRLSELFDKFGSDKNAVNGYGPAYDELLTPRKESIRSILEVGVFKGASIKAWHDFFPNAEIVGLDHDPSCVTFNVARIETFTVNSYDLDTVNQVLGDRTFDLIVDDGWHDSRAQAASLATLWPRLNPGGLYVVEDVLGDLGFVKGKVYDGTPGLLGARMLVLEKE